MKIVLICLTVMVTLDARRGKRKRFDWTHAIDTLIDATNDRDLPPMPEGLNCDQAMDELLLQLPSFGSIFYALLNGWYLGQWADYSSCIADATDAQYILATVKGNYNGPYHFTRGGEGKYTDGLNTNMGLCFPK